MTLEDLLAERTIYRQLIAFARAMDERDWTALDDIAAEDIHAELGMGEIIGRDKVVAFMRGFLDRCGATQHMLGNVIIDVDGDSAESSAYVCDMHLGSGEHQEQSFRTLGLYRDRWQRSDGRWLLVHRVKDNRGTLGSMAVFS